HGFRWRCCLFRRWYNRCHAGLPLGNRRQLDLHRVGDQFQDTWVWNTKASTMIRMDLLVVLQHIDPTVACAFEGQCNCIVNLLGEWRQFWFLRLRVGILLNHGYCHSRMIPQSRHAEKYTPTHPKCRVRVDTLDDRSPSLLFPRMVRIG